MDHKYLPASILVLALLGTAGCAVTARQSTVGQYVDDTTITTRVAVQSGKRGPPSTRAKSR